MPDFSSITNKAVPLLERMPQARTAITDERNKLNATPLRQYNRVEELKETSQLARTIMTHFKDHMMDLNGEMQLLRKELTSMNDLLRKKLSEESIIERDFKPIGLTMAVADHEVRLRQGEAQQAIADASKNFMEIEKIAAELESEALTMVTEAKNAIEEAEQAEKALNDAREDLERAQKEERERQKHEEERKRKEEEEKKRKEEEDRKEQEQKRKEEEEKQKRIKEEKEKERKQKEEEERKRKEEEERQKEIIRRDPTKWPEWIFHLDKEMNDISLACVIKVVPDTAQKEDFSVHHIQHRTDEFPLKPNESLVSNIIEIKHKDEKFMASDPMIIRFPHQAPINPDRDTVIKMKTASKDWWEETETKELVLDGKDMMYKFVECRVKKVNSFAVITRPKIEAYTVDKQGSKVKSTVDGRVTFNINKDNFTSPTKVTIQVERVDNNLITELHAKRSECSGLTAASPMIKFTTPPSIKRYTKKVMVNVPLPSHSFAQIPRPQRERPTLGAPTHPDIEVPEKVHILTQSGNSGEWSILKGFPIDNERGDVVMFNLDQPIDKFILVRSKGEVTTQRTEQDVLFLEEILYEHRVSVVMRQKTTDPFNMVICAAQLASIDNMTMRLTAKGYDQGQPPSHAIKMMEGDEIIAKMGKGNLQFEDNETEKTMTFHANLKTSMTFEVAASDRFAQKARPKYSGHVIVEYRILRKLYGNSQDAAKKTNPFQMVAKVLPILDILTEVPKTQANKSGPITQRVNMKINTDGIVNEELLRSLASKLEEDWKELAKSLGIPPGRIQATERNNINKGIDTVIYEMFNSWIKGVPKAANKVELLVKALEECQRDDLVASIREMERTFRESEA